MNSISSIGNYSYNNYINVSAISINVKAKAQAEILERIMDSLTEKEVEIVKRGRNAENHHTAKNATTAEYSHATAFEALIGYLYLAKEDERLKEILDMCID